jgi:hypothetical protein
MAFNPFHGFRKYRKVMFALLTIICMFVFILSGASGTFSELFTGKGRGSSLKVGSAFGKTIYAQDLEFLRTQREVANFFIVQALVRATINTKRDFAEALEKAQMESFLKDYLKQILQQQFAGFNQETMNQLERMVQVFNLQQKNTEANIVQNLVDVLYQERNILVDRELYFRGGKENKDLIDFMIWRHEADRLGIQLTQKDINRLVADETRNKLSQSDLIEIQRVVRGRYRITPEQYYAAVSDEFRVRIAQLAILGRDLRFYESPNRRPDPLTPEELWNYYREKRTEGTVALLPIAVNQPELLNKVGEPADDELKDLYEKNKYRLYDPSKEEAGFKQPKRYQVEWVRARPDAPQFKKATDIANATLQATLPLVYVGALFHEFEGVKYQFSVPSWHKMETIVIHDIGAGRPQRVAALIGQGVAAGGNHGWSAVTGLLAYQNTGLGQEMALLEPDLRNLNRAVASLMGSGSGGNPVFVLGTILAVEPIDKYLPMARIRNYLEEKYRETLTKALVTSSLKALEDDLFKLGNRAILDIYKQEYGLSLFGQALASTGTNGLELLADGIQKKGEETLLKRDLSRLACSFISNGPAPLAVAGLVYNQQNQITWELKSRVAQAIEKYKLEHGRTVQPRDQYDLQGDPGLDPLKTAYNQPFEFHQPDTNAKEFAKEVFNNVKSDKELYSPHHLGASKEFLYWKTDEKGEYIPSFAEARDKVVARRKFEKARQLAKEEAKKIADQAPKHTTGEDAKISLLDKSKLAGAMIDLDHVAPLVMQRAATVSRFETTRYVPYKIPQSKIEYPSAEMVNKLLGLKQEGEVTIVHDKPKANYYVAVLTRRPERYPADFKFEAERPEGLLEWYERDNKVRKQNLESCLKQLSKESMVHVDYEALKKLNRQDRNTED